ncbi:MAG: MBL fold metallo-hydrolase [Thermoprotei archaeon]
MVLVKWHGHACFELVDDEGFTIVIDPHDGSSIGLPAPNVKADAVLITHDHFDHNAYQLVRKSGETKVISMRKGEFKVGKHRVVGIESYHDKFRGRRRGKNILYLVEMNNIKFLHAGDLGDVPDPQSINLIRESHVMFIPVGGTFTLEPEEVLELVKNIKPKAVVPMHYWLEGITLPLKPLDYFLKFSPYEVLRVGREHNFTLRELEEWVETKVVVFSLK